MHVQRIPQAWWVVMAPSLFLGACGMGERADPGSIAHDSAGVRIVENHEPVWGLGSRWRLSDFPSVVIGVVEGDPVDQLYDVRSAKRLSDGRIAVANAGSNEIRIYDAQGDFLRALGGQGGGPGEFHALTSINVTAEDTILAWDRRDQRITVYGPEGDLVRTIPVQDAGPGNLWLVSRLSDGTYTFAKGSSSAQITPSERIAGKRYRKRLPILRFAADGTVLDTVGLFPGDEMYIADAGGRIRVGWPPFGRRLVYAGHGDRLYIGTQEHYEIGVYAPDGRLERIIRIPDVDLSVRAGDLDALRESLLARAGDTPDARQAVEARLATWPVPEQKPAYDQILADAQGNLWVAEFSPALGGEWAAWTIFDPEGRLLGRISVPDRFQVLDIGTDYVLGRLRDELDVERVRLYEFIKPSA